MRWRTTFAATSSVVMALSMLALTSCSQSCRSSPRAPETRQEPSPSPPEVIRVRERCLLIPPVLDPPSDVLATLRAMAACPRATRQANACPPIPWTEVDRINAWVATLVSQLRLDWALCGEPKP